MSRGAGGGGGDKDAVSPFCVRGCGDLKNVALVSLFPTLFHRC